jgi:hypothetical protein
MIITSYVGIYFALLVLNGDSAKAAKIYVFALLYPPSVFLSLKPLLKKSISVVPGISISACNEFGFNAFVEGLVEVLEES